MLSATVFSFIPSSNFSTSPCVSVSITASVLNQFFRGSLTKMNRHILVKTSQRILFHIICIHLWLLHLSKKCLYDHIQVLLLFIGFVTYPLSPLIGPLTYMIANIVTCTAFVTITALDAFHEYLSPTSVAPKVQDNEPVFRSCLFFHRNTLTEVPREKIDLTSYITICLGKATRRNLGNIPCTYVVKSTQLGCTQDMYTSYLLLYASAQSKAMLHQL